MTLDTKSASDLSENTMITEKYYFNTTYLILYVNISPIYHCMSVESNLNRAYARIQ